MQFVCRVSRRQTTMRRSRSVPAPGISVSRSTRTHFIITLDRRTVNRTGAARSGGRRDRRLRMSFDFQAVLEDRIRSNAHPE
jgi:hypothetical protein